MSVAGLIVCLAGTALYGKTQTEHPVLMVVNQGDHDVSLIDTVTERQTATVDVEGITGHEGVISPDGKTGYVPIYGDSGVGRPGTDGNKIVAIDLSTRKIVRTLQFDHGVRPHCVRYNELDGMLYVTTELDNSISIVDPHSLKVVGAIPTTQAQSHMLVISHSGRFGYTANVGPGTVSVLDMKARKALAVIPISTNTQRISISNDDSMVFTADQSKPQLAVIDTAANKLTRWIALPSIGYGTTPTPDGRWLLVALRTHNQVAAIDLKTLTVAHIVDTPAVPTEILVRPDGHVAYISCSGPGKIAALDLTTWTLTATINAGKGADGLAWGSMSPRS